MRTEQLSVVIIDKSPLVVDGLRELLANDHRFGRVVVASGVDHLISIVTTEVLDVVVSGWILPDTSGHEVLGLVVDSAGPPVVIYTGDPDPNIARTVMASGGAGYCNKSDPPDEVLSIVAEVARGKMVFPFVDVRHLHDDPLAVLTARERSFVAALANGHSNKELAAQFDVSVNTVKFHLSNAYSKIGARNRAQAVAIFYDSHDRI